MQTRPRVRHVTNTFSFSQIFLFSLSFFLFMVFCKLKIGLESEEMFQASKCLFPVIHLQTHSESSLSSWVCNQAIAGAESKSWEAPSLSVPSVPSGGGMGLFSGPLMKLSCLLHHLEVLTRHPVLNGAFIIIPSKTIIAVFETLEIGCSGN